MVEKLLAWTVIVCRLGHCPKENLMLDEATGLVLWARISAEQSSSITRIDTRMIH